MAFCYTLIYHVSSLLNRNHSESAAASCSEDYRNYDRHDAENVSHHLE
jgi:hypothetical protein